MLGLTNKRLTLFAPLFCLSLVFSVFWRERILDVTSNLRRPAFSRTRPAKKKLRTGPASASLLAADSDGDGMPDATELQSFQDRGNFRRWFRFIAEMQFYRLSDQWNSEQRDCAGLVRFAWREALRPHDRTWLQRMGSGYDVIAPDVTAYNLESGPLKEKLFRTNAQPLMANDPQRENFSEFADARTLKEFNSTFIGRDRRNAQPGDLLFFYQPWVQRFPYHVMIFIGNSESDRDGVNDFVVYHTGLSATDKGTVKKVQLSVLDFHPDKRWRPVDSNRNFLGFYRLKILD